MTFLLLGHIVTSSFNCCELQSHLWQHQQLLRSTLFPRLSPSLGSPAPQAGLGCLGNKGLNPNHCIWCCLTRAVTGIGLALAYKLHYSGLHS